MIWSGYPSFSCHRSLYALTFPVLSLSPTVRQTGAGDAEVLDFRDEACEAQVHEAVQFFFVIGPEHPQHILSARQRDAAHFYDGGAQQAVGETFEHPFCLHQPEQVGAAVIIRAVGAGAYSEQARYQRGIPGDKGLRHKAPGGLATRMTCSIPSASKMVFKSSARWA